MKTTPNENRFWLKMHQITAFWHGFGISNGKDIPKEMTHEIYTDKNGMYKKTPQKDGKTYIRVRPVYFQELLKDYIKWLETYKESWDNGTADYNGINTNEKFAESEDGSRIDILKMIDLLQECRIDK